MVGLGSIPRRHGTPAYRLRVDKRARVLGEKRYSPLVCSAGMNHEARMEIARRVTEFLLKRHDDIVAVALYASTAKGEDREHSDVEMYAITREESDTRSYNAIHDGVIVEAWLPPLKEVEREARAAYEWPFVADAYINHIALHDPDGVLQRLAAAARHPEPRQRGPAMQRALLVLYEYLCKIRNYQAAGEDANTRVSCPEVAIQAAKFLSLLNRAYFNGMRNLLTKPREFETLPPHFWEDFPPLVAVDVPTAALHGHAERIYHECLALWEDAGHTLPSGPDLESALEQGRLPR